MSHRKAVIRALLTPVTNPRPDGRKRNWTGEKTFPAGRYVDDGHSLRRVNGYRYDVVYNRTWGKDTDVAYKAIVANSEPVAPHGIRELLLTLGSEDDATYILGVLLHNNLIADTQIASAVEQLNASDDLHEQV